MISFSKFKLSNDLTVIHHKDDSTPLVCVNVLYDVGARDEDESRTGFAHLFEHLMFGGSVNIPNYDEPLQRVGGENNAFTTNDITNYYLTVPSQNIETAFWLESDRMMSLAFSEKSLDVQRNVVIEEFKQRYLNQPYGDVWLQLRPLAYRVHPYKWDTIGKEISHIADAKISDVKDFFKRFYCPSNAIVAVAGNIGLAAVKELTEKWFAPISPGEKHRRKLPQEPAQDAKRFLKLERDVPLDAIYKAYHMCSRCEPDYYTCDLISDILSGGHSSRLYNSLVKEKKLFSDISAFVTGDMDEGLLIVTGKLVKGVGMVDAERGIDEELQKLKDEPIGEDELMKVKNKIESLHVFGEMNISNKALNLAISELMGDADRINREIDKYRTVTSDRITQVCNKIFNEKNSCVMHYYSVKK